MFYIQQLSMQDCGFACLKMLIARTYKRKEFLYLQQDLNHGAYTLKELKDTASTYGLTLNGYSYKVKKDIIKDNVKNILISFANEDGSHHLVLLKRIRFNRFHISDPYAGEFSLKKEKFFKLWDKTILRIDEISGNINIPKQPLHLCKSNKILLTFIHALSVLLAVLGVYFIDDKFPPYIFVALFISGGLTEILYRILLIKSMKKLDKIILDDRIKNIDSKEQFIRAFSSFKRDETSLIPSLAFGISMTLFIIFLFILNDLNSFIPIVSITVLTFLDTIIFGPQLDSFSKNIEKNESCICEGNYENSFMKKLQILTKKSYKYAELFMLRKLLFIIIIISIVVSYSIFMGINNLAYMLFYCFGYWYLSNNISSIFSFKNKTDFLNKQRCYLMNVINCQK